MNSIDQIMPTIKVELNSQIQKEKNKLAKMSRIQEFAILVLGIGLTGASILAGSISIPVGLSISPVVAVLLPLAFTITGIAAGIIFGIGLYKIDEEISIYNKIEKQIKTLEACLSHAKSPKFQKMIEEVKFHNPKDIQSLLELDKCFVKRNELSDLEKDLKKQQKSLIETLEILAGDIRQSPPVAEVV